jgi:hypothetical protein
LSIFCRIEHHLNRKRKFLFKLKRNLFDYFQHHILA